VIHQWIQNEYQCDLCNTEALTDHQGENMKEPALFLDRDGVVNFDTGYTHRQDQFEFIPGIFELVAKATACGYKTFIVTNQAGIGRGYYTELEFWTLMNWVSERFVENIARNADAANPPRACCGKRRTTMK
jgi:HAD superfamily hydrolase (TIGR01662 family)